MRDAQDVPTQELIDRAEVTALQDPTCDSDEYWVLVRALHGRNEDIVFQAASSWCDSSEVLLRCLGSDVLGQLGYGSFYPFTDRSEPILASLLSDPDASVVSSALDALGHLSAGDPTAIEACSNHESAEVRESVAFCLSSHDDALSRATLIILTTDPDSDVRDWATWGLGTMSELDTPEIREALLLRLAVENEEVRGEAMRGLATRGDSRAIPVILEELNQEEVDLDAIKAAAELPDRSFLSQLEGLLEENPEDADIKRALERCRAEQPRV